jgi:hypothetical protein
VPVIEDAKGIIWVVGHAVAERVRALENTGRALRFEVKADPSLRSG